MRPVKVANHDGAVLNAMLDDGFRVTLPPGDSIQDQDQLDAAIQRFEGRDDGFGARIEQGQIEPGEPAENGEPKSINMAPAHLVQTLRQNHGLASDPGGYEEFARRVGGGYFGNWSDVRDVESGEQKASAEQVEWLKRVHAFDLG